MNRTIFILSCPNDKWMKGFRESSENWNYVHQLKDAEVVICDDSIRVVNFNNYFWMYWSDNKYSLSARDDSFYSVDCEPYPTKTLEYFFEQDWKKLDDYERGKAVGIFLMDLINSEEAVAK